MPVRGDGAPPARVLRLALSLDSVGATVGRAHFAVWLAGPDGAGAGAAPRHDAVALADAARILAMTRAARAMSHGDFERAAARRPATTSSAIWCTRSTPCATSWPRAWPSCASEGRKLRAIVNGMSEGVALVQDGIIAVANPAFARLLGHAGDVEGRGIRDAVRVPAVGDAIESRAGHAQRRASREVQIGGRALAGAGRSARRRADARRRCVVLIDVTEPKRLERLRREFVANASHELRTPVAAIVGVAETLAAGAADDPEARQSFLEILIAPRAAAVAPDRRPARHRAPRGRLQAARRGRSTSSRAVDAVHRHAAGQGRATSTSRSRRSCAAELRVSAERAAVEQILTNLVDNAIKYTPAGGRVRVRAEPRGRARCASSSRTPGPGIPAEHHARLFERFYRVDDARSRDLGGTGLGLAIVKHLALANGGDVSRRERGRAGSRFIVALCRATMVTLAVMSTVGGD